MTVDKTEENRLKITLSAVEIYDYFGSFKEIRYDNPRARTALGALLRRATDSRRFLYGRRRLYIKVLPTKGGGCVIYFVTEGHKKDAPAVLQFSGCGELLSACEKISKNFADTVAALYESGGRYRLLLPQGVCTAALEFVEGCYFSDFEREKTKEHWHKICDNTPLYVICGKTITP